MSRFSPIDLAAYPVADVLEALSFEDYLARDRAEFAARWGLRRIDRPDLPDLDTILLESDPASIVMEVGVARELVLRARVNDALRSLTLAGARGRALDHIGATYYRTPRREITPATDTTPAVVEEDGIYRQRLALAPEAWSIAGPVGAYLFHALSASGDVLDVAVYSEDEGVCLAPTVRVVVLSRLGDGTASAGLIETVRAALSSRDVRPLGDQVVVESATPLPFDVALILRVRAGASAAVTAAQAEARVRAFAEGRLRWIGEDTDGPIWRIGRKFSRAAIAAAAFGSDTNVLDVVVETPAADVNPAHVDYTPAALAGVGTRDFVPLAADVTAHLFRAPALGAVTIATEVAPAGWS